MLLVDKYRPHTLEKLDYHLDLSESLKNLAAADDFPHILFYGPSGAGKKTRIMALLRKIFGLGIEKLKIEKKEFKIPNKSDSLQVTVITSTHHIELSPAECGYYDRVVVQQIIKEIAQNQQIDTGSNSRSFKVVLLNEVDSLTKDAQHALRRTMEKYMTNCRIIMQASSMNNVIEAVRSRCLCIRVGAPDYQAIISILHMVSKGEGFSIPEELAERIAQRSNRNLRRALLMLEATKTKQYPLQPDQQVQQPDWEIFIQQLAKSIIEQQSPSQLLAVRGKLYELITHCIPSSLVIKTLALTLLEKVDNELKYEVIQLAAEYEHRMHIGSKDIFHLEAFVAKFMELYKRYLLTNFVE